VNQSSKAKWTHNDLVFPTHQSQSKPPPAYADYSQGKNRGSITYCTTPQPQTNAAKLAEISFKFKTLATPTPTQTPTMVE
jgi:hypothetical protein